MFLFGFSLLVIDFTFSHKESGTYKVSEFGTLQSYFPLGSSVINDSVAEIVEFLTRNDMLC